MANRPRRHRRHGPDSRNSEPPLMGDIRSSMASGHPIDLLMLASQMIEIATPRPLDAMPGVSAPSLSLDDLLESLLGFDSLETTVLLHAMLPLVASVATVAEVHSELERRRWQVPDWIRAIGKIEVVEAVEMTHILGDGENVAIEVRWPSGKTMTVLIYIDHNMGTVAKDAFPIVESLAHLRSEFLDNADDDSAVTVIDPADARARVDQAIEAGGRVFPPLVSETWPGCRSLVEFVVRQLPADSSGFERPDWTEADRDLVARAFLESRFGAPLAGDPDVSDIVETLLWFACDYGPGDPLRWSPTSIEVLLVDWFPRKIMADRAYMVKMPMVVRGLVQYAHEQRSIPAHLTAETLSAVDRWEPEYREANVHAARPLGAAQFLYDRIENDPHWDGPIEEYFLARLADQVGGRDTLETLSDAPLIDEPFDWSGIPDDIHSRVGEVLDITERCCDELLDVEYRTIVRRLLARAASGDPQVFRRRARTDYAAAALVWSAGRANELFSTMYVKDLMAWFGIQQGSISQRAQTLRKAAGIDVYDTRSDVLGDPDLLHSSKRRSIIGARDRYVDRLEQEGQ